MRGPEMNMHDFYFDFPQHGIIIVAPPYCATSQLLDALCVLLPKTATHLDPKDRWAKQAISKNDVIALRGARLVIGCVRNPWDWAIARFNAGDDILPTDTAQEPDFAKFIASLQTGPGVMSLADILLSDQNGMLPDFLLHYERLQSDFVMLSALINAKTGMTPTPLAQLDQEDHAMAGRLYTRAERLKVRNLYNREIAYFGYHFPFAVETETQPTPEPVAVLQT